MSVNEFEIINLTPHQVVIINKDKKIIIPVSGNIARVSVTLETIGKINEIPIVKGKYGDVTDLPEPRNGTLYIVSAMVRNAKPNRNDLFSTALIARDNNGQIIGCESLEGN